MAAVEQDFQQANDARVVEFDSGIVHRALGDGQGQALQQWKIHMDVQALGLETGKAVGDGAKSSAYRLQVIEPFLETKIAQIVGTKFIAQKAGELFILFEEGVLPVNPEDMMAMLDLIDDGRQLSP